MLITRLALGGKSGSRLEDLRIGRHLRCIGRANLDRALKPLSQPWVACASSIQEIDLGPTQSLLFNIGLAYTNAQLIENIGAPGET